MGIGLLTLMTTLAVAAECGDATPLVATAETAVVETRFSDAERALDDAAAALGCSPLGDRTVLARYWLAEGVMLHLRGDDTSATDSIVAVSGVELGYWQPKFGPQQADWYHGVVASAQADLAGTLRIEPPLTSYVAMLDGIESPLHPDVPSGLHLLQVGPSTDEVLFGRFVFVEPGQEIVVATGLIEPDATPEPLPTAPAPNSPTPTMPVFLIGSAAVGVLAAGTAVGALAQNGSIDDPADIDALNSSIKRQKGFAGTSYALTGVAALGIGLHFALGGS